LFQLLIPKFVLKLGQAFLVLKIHLEKFGGGGYLSFLSSKKQTLDAQKSTLGGCSTVMQPKSEKSYKKVTKIC
jgi:hypothetical protein